MHWSRYFPAPPSVPVHRKRRQATVRPSPKFQWQQGDGPASCNWPCQMLLLDLIKTAVPTCLGPTAWGVHIWGQPVLSPSHSQGKSQMETGQALMHCLGIPGVAWLLLSVIFPRNEKSELEPPLFPLWRSLSQMTGWWYSPEGPKCSHCLPWQAMRDIGQGGM